MGVPSWAYTWLAKDDPLTERKALTPRSIDEYSNVISNVYKKVIKKAADNPIEGRLVGKKQRMKSNRKPFTPDELKAIFDPARCLLTGPTGTSTSEPIL